MFPETKGLPLEEIAALFGDAEEVAIFSSSLDTEEKPEAVFVEHKGERIEPKTDITE